MIGLLERTSYLNYIVCHNRIKNRNQVHEHAKLTDSSVNILEDVEQFFLEAKRYFSLSDMEDRIIFDPGFGFAKTREQNLYLLDQLMHLFLTFTKESFLIGISRKSFLRDPGTKFSDLGQSEKSYQKEISVLNVLRNKNIQNKIYWRSHSLDLLSTLL